MVAGVVGVVGMGHKHSDYWRHYKESEKTAHRMKKIFANHISDKVQIYAEYIEIFATQQ